MTEVITGVPPVTLNPFVIVRTSALEVMMTVLVPGVAAGLTFRTALAAVGEVIVKEATVIPGPKVATVVP